MENEIEKMEKRRRHILAGMLAGTIVAFGWFMLSATNLVYRSIRSADKAYIGSHLLWLMILIIFGTVYLIYKQELRNNPSLRNAVNDERVRLCWLKSYRFAFFTAVGAAIIWKWLETAFSSRLLMTKMRLPNGPSLVLFVVVISLVGSFLFFDKGAKNE
jgi:hypothetical protein